MASETFPPVLTASQADGLACVVCGADYLRVNTPHVPVGRSDTGSQVFACVGPCVAWVVESVERLAVELRAAAAAAEGGPAA